MKRSGIPSNYLLDNTKRKANSEIPEEAAKAIKSHKTNFSLLNISFPHTPNYSNLPSSSGTRRRLADLESKTLDYTISPRISENFFYQVSLRFKKLTPREKREISKRIEKNKDLAVMPPEHKQELAKAKAEKYRIRAIVNKMTQEKIYQQKKNQRQEQLKQKLKKFNYRINLSEVHHVGLTWVIMETLAGVGTVCKKLIANRKRLRVRSLRLLIWLRAVCRFSGKFLRIKKRINQKLSIIVINMQKIRVFFLPAIKKWLNRRRDVYKKTLVYILEQQLSTAMLTKLIKNWQIKMVFLKKSLKNFLFFKFSLFESLLLKWNRTELQLFNREDQGHKRRATIGIKYLKNVSSGCTSIPTEVKIFYLRSAVKEVIRTDIQDYRTYKSNLQLVHSKNLKNKWTGYPDPIQEYPLRPAVPKIYELFNSEKISGLITFALQDRSNWVHHTDSSKQDGVQVLFRFPTQN